MPYRVLVADDNIINYMLMQESFKIFGVETIRAENGQEAIDICDREDGISMIFMDIRMPVMDGITASGIISKRWPNMKIVAFSAYCGEEFKEEALENGCLDFLTKPILIEQIDSIIKEHLYEAE